MASDTQLRRDREAGDRAYDEHYGLLAEEARPHEICTNVSTGIRHPYRDSAGYALTLLDTGGTERAARVLRAVLDGQDTDPGSPTYGIWPYFAEEPPARMTPPDWNWADFIGTTLALVLLRHSGTLAPELREEVRGGLRHAARSIVRRDVSMAYTNIAAKGTFVTLIAGQLLDDPELTEYGVHRIGRLRREVLEAGSFTEYNSPTYWGVAIGAVRLILAHVTDPRTAEPARWLSDRMWEHFARRWHSPTGQLSGPMSRCYHDHFPDTGGWVLGMVGRAAGYRPPFDTAALRRAGVPVAEDASAEPTAPQHVVDALAQSPTGTERERFALVPLEGGDRAHPVLGTTWRGGHATFGTVNTSEFWSQRRPLQAYWRLEDDVPWAHDRHLRTRFTKDGTDFCSAVFSSVQSERSALWAAGFTSPGGDGHIIFNPIPAGAEFPASSLRLAFELEGTGGAEVTVAGKPVTGTAPLEPGEPVEVAAGPVRIRMTLDAVVFGDHRPRLRVEVGEDGVRVVAELLPDLPDGGAHRLVLRDVERAYVVGTFGITETGGTSGGTTGGTRPSPPPAVAEVDGDAVTARWTTPDGDRLRLRAPATAVAPNRHLALYDAAVVRSDGSQDAGLEAILEAPAAGR